MVIVRGSIALIGGARLSAAIGSFSQFLLIGAILCFVVAVLTTSTTHLPSIDTGMITWLPTLWFLGLFEWLLGSARPPFEMLATRALVGMVIAGVGAVGVAVVGFPRQMQLAVTPSSKVGPPGRASLMRVVARLFVGRDVVARAISDFIVVTLARNRPQQAPIAIHAALAVALILAGLVRGAHDLASLTHPRVALFWIPSSSRTGWSSV
jgi:hypothetical protein